MKPEIITIGEPLVELSAEKPGSFSGGLSFLSGFGGDTSNFAVAAARSGADTAYISRIGKDPFGNALLDMWKGEGIDCTHVKEAEKEKTGIYFIFRNLGGHEFAYFRENSAASRITPDILPKDIIAGSKLLHLSGLTQAISTSACDTVFAALEIAKDSNVTVSYDPNLRLKLWSLDRARAIIHSTLPKVDLFLPSLDDASILTGLSSPEKIVDFYLGIGATKVILKLGSRGVLYANGDTLRYFDPHLVSAVDTSGAGDTFCGALAAKLVKGETIEKCIHYAKTAAALSTQTLGCVNSIPYETQVTGILPRDLKF